jgi:hypothetical protein
VDLTIVYLNEGNDEGNLKSQKSEAASIQIAIQAYVNEVAIYKQELESLLD